MVKSRNPRLSSSRGKKYKSKGKQKRSKSTRKSRKIKKRQCGGDVCFYENPRGFNLDSVTFLMNSFFADHKDTETNLRDLLKFIFGECTRFDSDNFVDLKLGECQFKIIDYSITQYTLEFVEGANQYYYTLNIEDNTRNLLSHDQYDADANKKFKGSLTPYTGNPELPLSWSHNPLKSSFRFYI